MIIQIGKIETHAEFRALACEWFVGHGIFRGWLEGFGSQHRALWVSADPRCRKSVLARYLVDDVFSTSERRTTCFFFSSRTTKVPGKFSAFSILSTSADWRTIQSSPMP
ncbi:hypothetical protein N657DRAFT_176149 [Parathielavia appendiculata]|uniref:Nephrocystin 3-like N-terminal domain-containing protein n=1 Tax=Parathielavia appendiculata TaxID=2587402 RepID=A0AAN6Z6V8_9PEZI|nr:hypothetical protein N657DRAFT_176149 [Parathielavia appendiculata]